MTEREIKVLQDAAARLDRRQSFEQFKAALEDYKAKLLAAKQAVAQAFREEYQTDVVERVIDYGAVRNQRGRDDVDSGMNAGSGWLIEEVR